MADSIYLFTDDNYSTAALELALSTDNFQMLVPGSEYGLAQHKNFWSDNPWRNGQGLIRHKVNNAEWPLRILAGDEDSDDPADDLANAIITFNRLIAQARRHHIDGDVDSVGLCVQLDGATNPTYFTVIDAEPDNAELLDEISRIRKDAQLTWRLITEPIGYGDEEDLVNYLPTPGFAEDPDADGLAANWNHVGTPTTAMDATYFRVGPAAQKVTTDASTEEGIVSDTVSASAFQGQSFVAYCWVNTEGDTVYFSVTGDVSGTLGTRRTDGVGGAVLDTQVIDGKTWVKLGFSATVGASDTTVTLQVDRPSAAATQVTVFRVDACYLSFDTSTIPVGWSSYYWVRNEYDPSRSGIYINYLDVADISGDDFADTELKLSVSLATTSRIIISTRYGEVPHHADMYKDESEGGFIHKSTSVSTSWVTISSKVMDTDRKTYRGAYVAIARIYDEATLGGDLSIRVGITQGVDGVVSYSDEMSVPTKGKWIAQFAGIVNFDYPQKIRGVENYNDIQVVIQAKRPAGSSTNDVRVDFFHLIPSNICISDSIDSSHTRYYYSSRYDTAYSGQSDTEYYIKQDLLGHPPAISAFAHNHLNFFCLDMLNATDRYATATSCLVYLRYRPRVRVLVGTK